MSIFHKIIYDRQDGPYRFTIDEKASGLWLFRMTYRRGKKDISAMTCLVNDHEEIGPFECYVENVWNKDDSKYNLRLFRSLFDFLEFNTVYFERSLDEDAKIIKWSVDGGVAGHGKTMRFR